MPNWNQVTLAGNLTRDPEIRYVASGAAVAKFTLAINRRTKTGEETTFVDVIAWDKLGELVNTHLKKGDAALVGGRLSIRAYEAKDGTQRKATEVVAAEVQFLSPKAGAPAAAHADADEADGDLIPF
jgi:single-strand DNA-binding protein